MNIKEESEEKEIKREENNKDAEENPLKKEQKNKLFSSISLRDKIKEMSKLKKSIFVIEKLSKQERKEDLEKKKHLREQELEQEEYSEVSDNYSSDDHYISNVKANNDGLKENNAYPQNINAHSNVIAPNNIINTTPLSFNSNNKNIFTVINKKNDNNGKTTSNDLNNMINMSYCTTNLNNNMANKEKESTIKRELWTQEEDNLLIVLLKKYIYENRNSNTGELIQAPNNFNTNPNIQVNIQNIINSNNNSTATPTDLPDEILLNINPNYIDWNSIATEMNTNPTTRKRYGKQLKERYINHLDPRVVKDYWTDNEERILLQKQKEFGNKWNDIARFLPGRTDNAVKNYFYSKLRRLIRYLVKSLIKNNRFKEEKIDENKYDLVFVYKLIKDTKIAFSDINKSRIIETIKDHMNGKIGVKEKSEKRKKRNDSNNNLVSNSNYNNESFYNNNNNDNNNRSISNKELHINESSCFSDAKNKPSNNKSKRVKFCYKGENDADVNTIKVKKDNCGFTNEGFNISVLNLNDIEEIILKYNIRNDSKVDHKISNINEELKPKASQYSVKTEGSCKSGNISKSRNESNASNNSKNNVNKNKYQIVTRRAMSKLSFSNSINDTYTTNNLMDISKTESNNNTNNTNITLSNNNKNNTEISKKNNNLSNKTKKTTPIVYPSLCVILSKNIFLKRKRRRMNKQATSKSQEKQIFVTNSQTQNANMAGNHNYLINNDKMLIDQYMKHKQNMPYLNQQQFFSMYNNKNRNMMMNNTNTLGNNLINNNNISSISNNMNNIPIIFNIKQENYYINNKRNKNNSNSNVIFNSYKLNKDSMNINNHTNNGLESCKFEPTSKNLNKKQIDYSLYDKINNNDTSNNNSNNSNEGTNTMQIHSPIRSNNILIKDDQTITNNNFSNNKKHNSSNFYYNNNNFNQYYGNYNNATNKSYNNHSNMSNNVNNSKQESSAEKNKMPNYNNNNNYNPFNNNSYYNNNINNPFSVTPSNLVLNQSFTPTNNENREINYQYRPLISPLNQGGIVFPNGNKFNDSFAISFKSLDFSNLNNASSFNNFVHNAPSYTNSNSNLNLFTASSLNHNKNNETSSNSNNINNFNYLNYNNENTSHTAHTGNNPNNINSANSNNINTVSSANNNISIHNISNNNMTSLNSHKSNANNNNNDKDSLNNNLNNNTVPNDEVKYTEIPTVATLKNKNFVFNSKDHNASIDYNMFNLSQTENTEYHYTSNYSNNNINIQNDNIKLNVPNSKTSNLSSLGFSYNYNNLNYINQNNKSYNGGVIKPIPTMMSNIHTLNNSSNNSNEKNNASVLNPLRENSGDEVNLNNSTSSNKNIPIKTLIKEEPSNTLVNSISNNQVQRNDTENNNNDNNSDPNLADKIKLIRPKPKRNFSLSLNIDEINNTDTGAVFINNCINNIESIQTESNQPGINKEAESDKSNSPKITSDP